MAVGHNQLQQLRNRTLTNVILGYRGIELHVDSSVCINIRYFRGVILEILRRCKGSMYFFRCKAILEQHGARIGRDVENRTAGFGGIISVPHLFNPKKRIHG